MNPILQQIIIKKVQLDSQKSVKKEFSSYDVAKAFLKFKLSAYHFIKDVFLISIGIIVAGFGLEGFLLPNSFIDGGVTGISLLAATVSDLPLPLLILIINIPFIVLGYAQLGKQFALKSIFAIVGLALAITFINYPIITSDKLLISVFGGFFLGAGIGFAIRGGGVLDGTEILAIYLSKRTGLTLGDIILVFNIIISKTVDFIIEGVEEYTGVTIISSHNEELRIMITEKLGRGVTIYNGKRGYGKRGDNKNEMEIVYTVITRLEIGRLQAEIEKIDPNAFIVMSAVKDTKGGMIKKRALHKE
jgi:uncharacterized membrane-anchored protein YitT (DUF2179 family)